MSDEQPLNVEWTNVFKRDYKRAMKRDLDITLLDDIIGKLSRLKRRLIDENCMRLSILAFALCLQTGAFAATNETAVATNGVAAAPDSPPETSDTAWGRQLRRAVFRRFSFKFPLPCGNLIY